MHVLRLNLEVASSILATSYRLKYLRQKLSIKVFTDLVKLLLIYKLRILTSMPNFADESIVPFYGPHLCKQFIRDKPL
jgi:hypothetical protein